MSLEQGQTSPDTHYKHSLGTRAKISAARMGQKHPHRGHAISPETREKISAANTGRTPKPETLVRLSAAHKGKKHSSESRAKISAANAGRKPSPEARANMSAAQTGRKHSPETRAKMSAAKKGTKHSPETRAKMSAASANRVHGLSSTKHYTKYRNYGLTPKDFDAMLTEQDNRCAVCGREFTDTDPPVVDHDHRCCPGPKTCGQCIGGLLHGGCNSGLGNLRDDPETCLMAAIYLRTRRKRFAGDMAATPSLATFYQAFLNIPGCNGQPLTSAIQ
jgi:hypothetical protein